MILRRSTSLRVLAVGLGLVGAQAVPAPASGAQLYGLTSDAHLVRFDTAAPASLLTNVWVSPGLRGIAAAEGDLITLSDLGYYSGVDPVTGSETRPSGPVHQTRYDQANDARAGLAAGRGSLHTITPRGWFRSPLPADSWDAFTGPVTPGSLELVGTAFDGARQYAIDTTDDKLVASEAPGVFSTVGDLGIEVGGSGAFEIVDGHGFLVVGASLYDVDLETGAATFSATLPLMSGVSVTDLSGPVPAFAAVDDGCCRPYAVEFERTARLRFRHRGDPDTAVTFTWRTTAPQVTEIPTAQPDADYVPSGGTVTVEPGETRDIEIPLIDDDEAEDGELLGVHVEQDARSYTYDLYVVDGSDPQFTATQLLAWEGQGTVPIEIERTGGAYTTATVDLTTSGTATPGEDFVSPPRTVTFAPGEERKVIELGLLADAWDEADETVALHLTSPTVTRDVSTQRSAVLTIRNSILPHIEQGPRPREGGGRRPTLTSRTVRIRANPVITVVCPDACGVDAKLRLPRARARTLRVPALVAHGHASRQSAGRLSIRLPLTGQTLSRLRRAAPERASLGLAVTDRRGSRRAENLAVFLRRVPQH